MNARRKRGRPQRASKQAQATTLRIVGGSLGGRKLQYSGDPRVRPMKDRTREAVFNLIGPISQDSYAIDLFAGTGAMGIEAISRGAAAATLIEIHEPTAKLIRDNIRGLDLQEKVQVLSADVFHWVRRRPNLPDGPWLVFCCPPYRLYGERTDDLLKLLADMQSRAAENSIVVVEADQSFDVNLLSDAADWRVRDYPPARVAVGRLSK